ncbi:alpha/beta hydrolase [candidate division WOR-3 bacterium]|nr:alpha/beta hydrolase [candidate division WOR-3 bacterium]
MKNCSKCTFFVIVISTMFSCAWTPAIKNSEGKRIPQSIASLEEIELGGIKQWILIRGEDVSKPILLFLHGGPGCAEMPLVTRFNPDLEKLFVVVMWDQRGAGKSYSRKIPEESMTIEQYIDDTRELTQILKERFGRDKIYLAGHSWGSGLGMFTVDRYPEDYYAFVGIGQIVNLADNELTSWRYCYDEAISRDDKKAINQLEEIGPPEDGVYKGDFNKKGKFVMRGLGTERKWLTKYEGWWFGETGIGMIVKTLLTTKEYTLGESIRYLKASNFSLSVMWPELLKVDLEKDIPEVKIPVYFCVGRHDYNTPGELSYPYYEMLAAPEKDFFWFERSAHSPCFEEPLEFNQVMKKVVAETYSR